MSIFKRNNKKGITDEGIKQGQFEIQKTLKDLRELSMDDLEKVCGGVLAGEVITADIFWAEVYALMLSGMTQIAAAESVKNKYGFSGSYPKLSDDLKSKYPGLK